MNLLDKRRRASIAALFWFALLLPGVAGLGATVVEERPVPVSAALVEDLALYYALESYQRVRVPLLASLLLPGGSGKKEAIADLRANPPLLDERGVAYPFGDSNPLSFVYDEANGALSIRWRLVRARGGMSGFGFMPQEAADLLNSNSTERERGGAIFAWDPLADALSLHLNYARPPADRDRFYRQVDRVLRAGGKWFEGRYLKVIQQLSAEREIPVTAIARTNGFEAALALRHFSVEAEQIPQQDQRYKTSWLRKVGHRAPTLLSDRSVRLDQTFKAYLHFEGAAEQVGMPVAVHADYRMLRADDSEVFRDVVVAIWQAASPPPGHQQLGTNNLVITLGEDELPGTYRLLVEVCELRGGRCVELEHPFEVLPTVR